MVQIRFYFGGSSVTSEQMTKEKAESLIASLKYHQPFANGTYSATIVE